MARYAEGDAAAFEELFHRYEPRAYSYFLARIGSRERARDLYQDLFLRLHRARDDYDPTRPFTPWLFQIAHRLLVDDLRRAHRFHEVPLEDRELRCDRPGSDEQIGDRERLGRILDALSLEEREVLLAAKLEGVAYPELAARLGKSVDAVKKMLSRALLRLRAATHLTATAPTSRSG